MTVFGIILLVWILSWALIAFGGCELLPDDISTEAELGVMIMAPLFAAYIVLKLFARAGIWILKNLKPIFGGGINAMLRSK
jgi:hypothetical protein